MPRSTTDRRIAEVLSEGTPGEETTVAGWVRTKRSGKQLSFLEINDGSSFDGLQVVIEHPEGAETHALKAAGTGASVRVVGTLQESPGKGQRVELLASSLELLGDAPEYPLQKKGHTLEFLREIAHLRVRTNTFGAVTRVRNSLSFAVHRFFQERGFFYVHTPIITTNDAEGAGSLFRVSGELEGEEAGREFFGRPAYLTVSGQLNAEACACGLSRVYTFGPTFRAENSNTSRHLSEFWMIEPEMAFCDIACNMSLAEEFVRFLISVVLEECPREVEFFEKRYAEGLSATLRQVVETPFRRITYTEAIAALSAPGSPEFEFTPAWGSDLQSEHERYLTETVFGGPVIVGDYPKQIKAFYMRQNDDGKTVRAMDVLVPRLGEIIGGSQREERLEVLEERMRELGMEPEDYGWYLDLRRYGTVEHSGFGLGFERFVQYVTGLGNIRDVIPFPRSVGSASF
ncbi:MAG: asparagine--tRNA ligase [Spirochaetaceae bacterium]